MAITTYSKKGKRGCQNVERPEYIERGNLLQDVEETCLFSGRTGHLNPKQIGAHKVVQRIKAAPAADVAPVVKELRPVVRLLHKEYERAKKNPIVYNPLAYALYQVWKAVDNCENGR